MSDFWVRAAGGQDYVVSHQNEQHRKKLMVSLKQATKAVITDSVDSDRPLTAAAESVNALCYRLEAALCHGLQGGDGKYRGQMVSFWDFIKHCIKSTNSGTLKRSMKEVEKLQRVHTADGQGRAWIRFALNNSIVFKAFDVLTKHKDIFKGWYAGFALMACHEETSMLLSLISSLNDIEFDLALDDPNLDCAVIHDEPGQAKYPAAAPSGHAPTKKKRKKRIRTTVAVIEEVKAKKGTSGTLASTDDAEAVDLSSIAAAVEASPQQAQDADLNAVIEALAENIPSPSVPPLKKTEAEVAAANKMRIEEERLERERQQLAEEQRKFEEEKRKLLELQQKEVDTQSESVAATAAAAAAVVADAEAKAVEEAKLAAEAEAAEEGAARAAAEAEAAAEARRAEEAQREAEQERLAEERARAEAEEAAELEEEQRIARLLEEQREKERARKATQEEARELEQAQALESQLAAETPLTHTSQTLPVAEEVTSTNAPMVVTAPASRRESLAESDSVMSVADLIDNAQDRSPPEELDEEAKQHLLDRIIETTPATVYSPSHSRGLSVGTNYQSSGSAEELNDQDIEAIMNSIEATAYVDEIDIDRLIAETVVTVPGDRRDYFSLAVAADPTPLLQTSPTTQEVHIVDALPEASGPPQPELESGGGPFVRQGRMVRTEEGEMALDLTDAYTDLSPVPRGPPGWKPLRRLVYFHIHTKTTTEDQDNICAGCAAPFSFGIFSTIRYCEYFGKFFCSRCHDNDTYFIPGRILQRWDLTHYKVSRKALEFLETIYDDPLFDVTSINPALYEHNPDVRRIKVVRQQLFYMKDFLVTCNQHALSLMDAVDNHRRHLVFDKQIYSLRDFVETAQGTLLPALHSIAEGFIVHIKNCQLCRAKGFICEFCNEEKPIYPFQLKTVVQCVGCKSFFHRRCYKKEKCPKCLRKLMLKHERQYKAELEYEE